MSIPTRDDRPVEAVTYLLSLGLAQLSIQVTLSVSLTASALGLAALATALTSTILTIQGGLAPHWQWYCCRRSRLRSLGCSPPPLRALRMLARKRSMRPTAWRLLPLPTISLSWSSEPCGLRPWRRAGAEAQGSPDLAGPRLPRHEHDPDRRSECRKCYASLVMWRKKHSEPEVREAMIRVGSGRSAFPTAWTVDDGPRWNIGSPEADTQAAPSRVAAEQLGCYPSCDRGGPHESDNRLAGNLAYPAPEHRREVCPARPGRSCCQVYPVRSARPTHPIWLRQVRPPRSEVAGSERL